MTKPEEMTSIPVGRETDGGGQLVWKGRQNMDDLYATSQHTFSVKNQMVRFLGFADHMVSVATALLCHASPKTIQK